MSHGTRVTRTHERFRVGPTFGSYTTDDHREENILRLVEMTKLDALNLHNTARRRRPLVHISNGRERTRAHTCSAASAVATAWLHDNVDPASALIATVTFP